MKRGECSAVDCFAHQDDAAAPCAALLDSRSGRIEGRQTMSLHRPRNIFRCQSFARSVIIISVGWVARNLKSSTMTTAAGHC
jgi:hypothetical protein